MSHEVAAALIVRSQKILLGHRSAGRTFYPNVWDVFGGHVEPGEQPEQTLIRELQEELGITPTQWMYLEGIAFPSEPSDPVTVYLYLVTGWTGSATNRQLEEHSTIGWFSLEQAAGLPLAHPDYPTIFAKYLTFEK
jgi:8-oxo-dGTP diphosphatase